MRLLILLALCVAASQARSTQSGSRMKLLSRVLDFLEERDDEPVPEAECECPTATDVVDFIVEHLADLSESHESDESLEIERPEGICPLRTCDGLSAAVQGELGCNCPAPGAEPDDSSCPRFLCFALNGGPPGGRSGPRGGGGRGPPSGEDSADGDKRHARRHEPEDGDICLCPLGPDEQPHPDDAGYPPCMNGECDESPEDSADDDKRHARRDESESCECRPPPPPGAGPPPEGAPPPCPPEDCSESESSEEERRASSLKTRALVNLLKSLLHKK